MGNFRLDRYSFEGFVYIKHVSIVRLSVEVQHVLRINSMVALKMFCLYIYYMSQKSQFSLQKCDLP